MGVRELASALLGEPREQRSSLSSWMDRWASYGPAGPTSVGHDAAQAHSAVYACVDLLVRLIAWQMPVYVGDTPVSVARPGVLSITENPHPEPQMTRQHWEAQVLESAIMRGFAAGLVTSFSDRGFPRQILPVQPDLIGWSDEGGRWRWTVDGRPAELWQAGGDLWVAPSMRVPAGRPVGRGVLWHAQQHVVLGLSAGKFGRDFFDAGGMPVAHGKVLDTPNLTEEQATTLKRRIVQATRNREPLVTGSNFELGTIHINAEESQFLETMQANVADVCRFFGVPPEAVGGSSGDSMTYANVEGRNLALLTNTVGAWMQWLEAMWSTLLPGRQAVALDPEALLRTSVPTLFTTALNAVGGQGNAPGLLTVNEARAMLGYDPFPGADTLMVPSNYVTPDEGGGKVDEDV